MFSGFPVQIFRFRFSGTGFQIQVFRFRFSGSGFRVQVFELRFSNTKFSEFFKKKFHRLKLEKPIVTSTSTQNTLKLEEGF